jgi:hypothetical protein
MRLKENLLDRIYSCKSRNAKENFIANIEEEVSLLELLDEIFYC